MRVTYRLSEHRVELKVSIPVQQLKVEGPVTVIERATRMMRTILIEKVMVRFGGGAWTAGGETESLRSP
jgi:hypothetical protein